MKPGRKLAAFLVIFLLFGSVCLAVDTAEIDRVRAKGVLDGADLDAIESFVAEGIEELVGTTNFTSAARIRAVLSSRSTSTEESAKAQYSQQFFESAKRHLERAFKEADKRPTPDQKFKTTLNLLILADDLGHWSLADLAIPLTGSDNKAIRYWAVHCVTNHSVAGHLNSSNPSDKEFGARIINELRKSAAESEPETLALIVNFAGLLTGAEGEDLLVQIADARIKSYQQWTVKNELLDGQILLLLDGKMTGAGVTNTAVARRFAQLYSCAIQRYIKGRDILDAAKKQELGSVLVEIEKSCISKRLGIAQAVIKRAVENDEYEALMAEHNRLLGDNTQTGQLLAKLDFDYGKNANGGIISSPANIPDPPAAEASGQ